jgi:hypothetical protein
MASHTKLLAALGLFLLGSTPLVAQQPTPPDSVALRAAKATLRSDLRNFLVAQERYFADHSTYAVSMRELAATYVPSRGVTIVLLTSARTGHTEIAIIDRVPGLVCGLFVGSGPSPLGTGNEGEPVCHDP